MSRLNLNVVEAVIFDLFGVLAENGWGLIDNTYKPTEDQWSQMSAISHAADKGIISMDQLEEGFAETLGTARSDISRLISAQKKNLRLLDTIRTLKSRGLKIGLISNVASGFVEDYFSPEELDLFDVRILSNEEGLVKPDPLIYKKAATSLGAREEECLFIDDSQINVVGAEAVGMQAILYQDLQALIAQIDGLL